MSETQTIARKQDSYQGDTILENLEMGSEQGFSKVAKYWLENGCMSFDQAKEVVDADQKKIHDIRGPLSEWDVVAHDNRVTFNHTPTGVEYTPTDHALNLLCQVGKGLSTWTVRSLREPIGHPTKKDEDGNAETIKGGKRTRVDFECLRDYIKIHVFNASRVDQSKERLFRTWTDGTLRAVLSNQYSIVNNAWFLDVLSQVVPGGVVSHWMGDADSIYGNILIPDTIRKESESDFGGMLSVGNSEIGTRRISSMPSVFRAICMNGCIWDQTEGVGISKVHKGQVNFEDLAAMIRENLETQIPLLPQGIERLLGLRAFGCGDTPMVSMVAQTAIDHSLSKRQVAEVVKGWMYEVNLLGADDGKTAYGLACGITRAAQRFDRDTWVRFDTIAGDMTGLDRDGWDKFRSRANGLTSKQVEKRVGELAV